MGGRSDTIFRHIRGSRPEHYLLAREPLRSMQLSNLYNAPERWRRVKIEVLAAQLDMFRNAAGNFEITVDAFRPCQGNCTESG